MATKLDRKSFPTGHSAHDFACFGPTATQDGAFDNVMMVDLGCMNQEEADSNKFYHAAVVQSKKNLIWFTYFEWGRTGAKNRDYQFLQCSSKEEAQRELAKQCHDKNDKRGVWKTVGSVKLLTAKPGKDVYLVRDLAKRDVGLPDAQTICSHNAVPTVTVNKKVTGNRFDTESTRLMRDLLGGAVTYTRAAIEGGAIPSQKAIDQGRELVQEVLKRLIVVGDDVQDQIADKQIRNLTYALYAQIPKKKPLHCPDEDWILSNYTSKTRHQSTLDIWGQDFDAFESALKAGNVEVTTGNDPFNGFASDFHMEWIDPKSEVGNYLMQWWPNATRNVHANVGKLKIKNLWKIRRENDEKVFRSYHQEVLNQIPKNWVGERPLHQDKNRADLSVEDRKRYYDANVCMTFHGTRSVNVGGICRENLRLPKNLVGVKTNGALIGPGLYFADDFKKSVGYTSDPNSFWITEKGAVAGRNAFMFVCDTIIGVPHIAPQGYGYTSAPAGKHSVFGKANYTSCNGGKLKNNEWVTYNTKQHVLRYLAEFVTYN